MVRKLKDKEAAAPVATAKRVARRGASTRQNVSSKLPADSSVPIVAIGASAGGLEPLIRFLAAMPPDSGYAFIVIQHLDPAGKSLLPELLTNHTAMKVQHASEGVVLLPNQVYVIPPGIYLSIKAGKLHLKDAPSGFGARMPIDGFLLSLAADYGRYGSGIILSGTGTDGAQGLKTLKEAGGLALVQEPSEAQHSGMPEQAIRVASPDYVLPVAEMPDVLLQHIAHAYSKPKPAGKQGIPGAQRLEEIVELLKSVTGQDFKHYKTGTVQRRIERRMGLHAIESWNDYIALLRRNTAEAEVLAKELLIYVTQFFRNPDAFAYLAKRVLPELLSSHSPDQPVRIWVPGCSTGEEAYTFGILLLEQMAHAKRPLKLQIFATDIDEEALQTARTGVYAENITADVSPERLERFFTPFDHRFKIAHELRQAVIFSRHDLLKNPPFSRLDLISCRNLFIYLQPDAQNLVLRLFHFALRENGLLFLGSAESTGDEANLFAPVDPKHRIYKRVNQLRSASARLPLGTGRNRLNQPRHMALPKRQVPLLADMVERKILEVYAPAAVATNEQLAALYFCGPINRYLQIAPGEPTQDVLSMANETLRPKLREAIARAFRTKRPVAVHGVRFKPGSKQAKVTIEVQHIADDLTLVSFIDEPPSIVDAKQADGGSGQSAALAEMQEELADTRKELNRTIRELRRANEEMMAANEEAVSLNEELLSANEELETSKEELQSLNEELTTLNGQLQQSLEQQQQTSTDLANLLNSSGVATLFLDSHLNIKVFNPAMQSLFAIIDKDVGRPIADLLPKFSDPDLLQDAIAARSKGLPIQREVHAESGAWYLRTVLPYRTESGDIQGEVVTFTDVSQLKQAMLDAAAARGYAEAIVDSIREPLVVFDTALKILSVNAAFETNFGLTSQDVREKEPRETTANVLLQPKLHEMLGRMPGNRATTDTVELEVDGPSGGGQVWRASARHFRPADTAQPMILLALDDITDQRRILRRQLQMMIDAMPGAVLAVDSQRCIQFVNGLVELLFGYRPNELTGRQIDMLVPMSLRDRHAKLHAGYVADGASARPMGTSLDIKGLTKDGEEIPLDIGLGPVPTADGLMVLVAIHDLRAQKQGEIILREAVAAADRANQVKSRFVAAASHDLRHPLQTFGLLLGVLTKRTNDPDARTIIGKLEDAIAGMAELLDTLLDINQIDAGAIKPDISDVPVGEAFAHLSEIFAPMAAAKGLELRIVPSSAVIRSDRHLFERMVGNLLSNAIKYTDHGRILLGCRRYGGKFRIEVWDTGIGIPENSMEAVFEEFYRLNPEDSARFGLGLGLYIVQRFASFLDHTIEVRSRPGKGTMFAVVAAASDMAARRLIPGGAAALTDLQPPVILLIEDDPKQLDSLRLLLESEGYRIKVARKGDAALALVRNAGSRPDVILADYHLPGGMTGLQIIKELRSSLGAQVPALIVSGDKSAPARAAFEASAQAFITKPVKAAELLARLRALAETVKPGWLDRRPRGFAGAPPAPASADAAICVIDDDPGVCDAMQRTLQAEGYHVATYPSGEMFLAVHNRAKCRCLVVDVGLSNRGLDGLELQSRLKAGHSSTPIIFVTGTRDLPKAVKAIRDGAADFLEKPVSGAELCASVAQALAGVASDNQSLVSQDETAVSLATLTERERQVMDRMVAGEASKIIAADLGISQRTVEHHRQSVKRKMDVKSLAALVRLVGLHHPPGQGGG